MFLRVLGAVAALLLVAAAPPAVVPAERFGAREAIGQISLSPNGDKVAFIAPGSGPSTIVYVADVAGGHEPTRVISANGNPERIVSCGWVSERRLVCKAYFVSKDADGEVAAASRMIAVDADGKNSKMLSRDMRPDDLYIALGGGDVVDWLPAEDGAVLMARPYVPEARMGTNIVDKREGLAVDRIDTGSLAARTVEQPKPGAAEYISDGRGKIRIMGSSQLAGATGYANGQISYFYRTRASDDWRPLGTLNLMTDEGFSPSAVDPDLDIVYGFRKMNGRWALHAIALDGSLRETEIFSHPEVDVDGLVRIGRRDRVVGATFATEKREAIYFDKDLKALAAALSKALPGLPLIRWVDSSVDESKLLLWAGSDNDPGRFYLFDKATKHLNELMLSRPQLEGTKLATVKPVSYKAADGTMIPAYLTLPPGSSGKGLPAIVMPHGGPSSRDEWGFDWLAQYFAARGYAVLQPNYRGSAGYGDVFFEKNGFQSWRTAMGDIADAGRWLASEGIADPSKLAIFGWSYGGYAALQVNVIDPKLFKAVVAVAPVTDLRMLEQESRNWSNHLVASNFIGSGQHIVDGSPAQNADKIQAPVLIFHGEMDRNVGVEESKLMDSKLRGAGKQSELVLYPGLDHQLDDGTVRAEMLSRSDAFLRGALHLN